MRVTTLGLTITLLLRALAVPLPSRAAAATVPRIGFVGAGSPASAGHHVQAFVQGLRELGHVTGQNIVIEHRWARES